MSKYGLNRYNLAYYGIGDDYKYLTPYFEAIPVSYGSIQLDWSIPGGTWSELVLVRNTLGFPIDPDDGDVVLISTTGLPPNSPDSDLQEGVVYYYSIFVKDTTFNLWHKSGDASSISVKNFGTEEFMWELIPTGMRSNTRNIVDGADENEHLRQFIRLLAFEYDTEKTYAFIMLPASNTLRVSHKFLSVLMNQFGMVFEPSLGYQRSRSIIANAASLYKSKGSLYGLKLFIKSFSGYDCEITSGKNLMLDYNSSSFEESVGTWQWSGGQANLASVGPLVVAPYNEPSRPAIYPNRQLGSLSATASNVGYIGMTCDAGGSAVLSGIPVTESLDYTFSIYAQADTDARSITITINWFDKDGQYLTSDSNASGTDAVGSWTRMDCTGTAPSGAVFAVPGILVASTVEDEVHYFDAAQFEQSSSATDFEDARLITIKLIANRINELSNPNFEVSTSPWSFIGTAHEYIISSSGGHPHNTVSGYALELYPNAPLTTMSSENITTVLEGNSYAFSVYAQLESYGATPQSTDLITAKIKWYDAGNALLQTDVGTPTQGSLTEWVRPSVVGTAPTGVSYAVVSIEWPASSYNLSITLDTALFEKNAFVDSFFDGTSGFASVSDLIWEGTPDSSRSHYYKNFASVFTRINELMPEYITYGSSYQMVYAQP